ncbi:hypothetical protein [Streptomyces soliscabiei]|uniref:hypothetical protein n=1 Tax=Streptomyces soliscabiei TaxID=588897 RepID=UPI0029A46DB0|nr:hypothetical protein [Streptomyces sp. NY05-11A]MDX2676773.1 hypothetical protein [Streptomyces sp. NY05-11A]
MDLISAALLAALAGGAGGEAGRQAWSGLAALVRRPFQRSANESAAASPVSSGEVELTRLANAPANAVYAQTLSTALAVRAALDDDFSSRLQQWHEQAKLARTGDGKTSNSISGGTFNGPVLQGRDFSGLSFTPSSPQVPADQEPDHPSTQGQ